MFGVKNFKFFKISGLYEKFTLLGFSQIFVRVLRISFNFLQNFIQISRTFFYRLLKTLRKFPKVFSRFPFLKFSLILI